MQNLIVAKQRIPGCCHYKLNAKGTPIGVPEVLLNNTLNITIPLDKYGFEGYNKCSVKFGELYVFKIRYI